MSDEITKRAVEVREKSRERLSVLMEEAKEEYIRIQTIDELLGESTGGDVFPDPFSGEGAAKKKVHRLTEASPKKTSSRKRRSVNSKMSGPTVKERVEKVLRRYPGREFTVNQFLVELAKDGGKVLRRESLQSIIMKLHRSDTPWLERKEIGTARLYTLAQSHIGTSTDEGNGSV